MRATGGSGVHWRTFWATVGVVALLLAAVWAFGRFGGQQPPPPPQDRVEEAPGPDNLETALPAELPGGTP